MWHASLLIAVLALFASFGDGQSPEFASTAHDCVSLTQTAETHVPHPATARSIEVTKTTLTRTIVRIKTTGDRAARTIGLGVPSLHWQPALERPTALLHIDHDRSGHSGRAPPTSA